ncbi:kinase-like protein [Westerdykella ornata]|uniref:non-specific serine/threonine protein kinase n=1 Tax=Westerdykella ornata TaxID=318751 RepID=A0A6A6J568_WESOR|nr:kinase-like protein [Westerdykella ornata]KAF2271532.1 kinase-like protein [Westerdykella ornata]
MEDLIACLYPFDDDWENAQKVIENPANSPEDCHRYVGGTRPPSDEPQGRQSRETTAPPDDGTKQPQDRDARLELRFSHKLKGGLGIVFGTNQSSCDIVLPSLGNKGQSQVSNRHCYITFDAQRRPVVQDCSRHGTIVTYNCNARERRRNFKWIIGGEGFPDEIKTVVIEIHPKLKFQIVVPKDHGDSGLFSDNVDQFLKEIANNDQLPLGALGIRSTIPTAAPSGSDTPSQRPIFLEREKLGEGSFGVVSRVWNVSTGLEYASKKCHNPDGVDWRREADVIKNTSHPHIVKLHFALDGPPPRLVLEYLPLGNLEEQHRRQPISEPDVHTLLRQCSSALSYLHSQEPPIVHRDIKPENILVSSRSPFSIKLSDFGLAKAGSFLETRCGTRFYAAPEIAAFWHSPCIGSPRYTSAVDIWSLGVVVLQYGYGLPGRVPRPSYYEQVVEKLRVSKSDSLLDILSGMLVIDPKRRYSAKTCLERAGKLEGSQTPRPMNPESQRREGEQSQVSAPDPTASRQDEQDFGDSETQRYKDPRDSQRSSSPDSNGDIREQVSLDPVRDSGLEGYSSSIISGHSGGPTIRGKRKSSTATSPPSAKRTKRTVTQSSSARLQHGQLSSTQISQHDQSDAGHGGQNNRLGRDASSPVANAPGSLNDRQGTTKLRP